ncbi:MAG: hypothetical protein ACXWJX_13525 [Limisphaerales bacterium]
MSALLTLWGMLRNCHVFKDLRLNKKTLRFPYGFLVRITYDSGDLAQGMG